MLSYTTLYSRSQQLRASQLSFLRLAWRGDDRKELAAGLGEITLDFCWEFYGAEHLTCPIGERSFLRIAQQLASCSCSLLDGRLGGSATRGFAAACGVACHQLCVTSSPDALTDLYKHLLGAGMAGHWMVLRGVDALQGEALSALLAHLTAYFEQLGASLEHFAGAAGAAPRSPRSPGGPDVDFGLLQSEGVDLAALASRPSAMRVRGASCVFDPRELRLPREYTGALCGSSTPSSRRGSATPVFRRGVSGAQRATASRDEGDSPAAGPLSSRGCTAGGHFLLPGRLYIPRVMHPQVAVFVAPSSGRAELRHPVLRSTGFPQADISLYIQVGLIRAEILDPDAARMLGHAISCFNAYTMGGSAGGGAGKQLCRKHMGVSEVRSICALAASLKRARSSLQASGAQVDDHIILCEAWLNAASAGLDASVERELLWECTLRSFGRATHFAEVEGKFRQNLVSDMLVSQRVMKKDLNARLYDAVADRLRQKFSFDFFNPLIAQKCVATAQGLLQRRDIAIVGEAGTGKTDCLATLLEVGRELEDDEGKALFPNVRLLRVNTLAHELKPIVAMVTRAAQEAAAAAASGPAGDAEGAKATTTATTTTTTNNDNSNATTSTTTTTNNDDNDNNDSNNNTRRQRPHVAGAGRAPGPVAGGYNLSLSLYVYIYIY